MSLARNLLTLFVVCCLLTACGESSVSEDTINFGEYKLTLPTFLSKRTDLHEDAQVQFGNLIKEFYLVVLAEPVALTDSLLTEGNVYTPNLNGYTDLHRSDFALQISTDESLIKINRHTTKQGVKINWFEGEAIVEKNDVYFLRAVIKHKQNYYQIGLWTLADQKEKYKSTMLEIVKSFTPN
jgi:hypothetical protein